MGDCNAKVVKVGNGYMLYNPCTGKYYPLVK